MEKPMKIQNAQKALQKFAALDRAVVYARVSGDDRGKEGRNLQGQIDMGRDYCLEKNYKVVDELAEDDKGASGYEIDLPKLNQIREMARNSEFNVLVVRELDRLSRNLAKQLIIEEELRRHGVKIEYVLAEYEDTPEGRLQKHIRATVAEYEREKIRERMVRGRNLKVKSGKVLTGSTNVPYGYRLNDDRTMFVIYEPEAQIVRLIFTLYTEGEVETGPMTINEITRRLNEMGVPTHSDNRIGTGKKKQGFGKWGRSTIHEFLKNEVYIGVWYYGKHAKRNGKHITNPKERWIRVDVPPIVSEEVWKQAQEILEINRQRAPRNNKVNQYLVSKRAKCVCGSSMYGTPSGDRRFLYYRCAASFHPLKYSRICEAVSFRVDKVDPRVWEWIEEVFTDRKKLERGMKGYEAQQEQVVNPLKERLAVIDSLLKEHDTEWENEMANLSAAQSKRAKAAIGTTIKQIEHAMDELQQQRDTVIKQLEKKALTEEQKAKIRKFADGIAADMDTFRRDFEGRRLLMDLLDIQVTLLVENGRQAIDVAGKIGPKRLYIVSETTDGGRPTHNLGRGVLEQTN
jgi:site-specific DNA recombinase